ncbi:MAG: lytic murein transglycosylase [Pseudomonadota bacterium]|nr:lytic murein transglycosylase [Pseudomonadota bacterium]
MIRPAFLRAAALAAAVLTFASTGAFAADAAYERFVRDFRAAALRAGVSAKTYDAAFKGLEPDPEVVEKNASQPEVVLPASHYLALTVTDTRIRIGREKLTEHAALLDAIEKKYGVDKHVLLAIWGMETNFGAFLGGKNVIRSLSTLAYKGRRTKFGRSELMVALKILERGDITYDKMNGSWAGAMGQTQMIPTTYERYAVDYDGDGKRDIWTNPADALASTANYLAKAGKWGRGERWGYEVILPKGFSSRLEGQRNARGLDAWKKLGLMPAPGNDVPEHKARAWLSLPAGTEGPALLIRDNFRSVMAYNAAYKYALAVSHLSDRLRGMPAFSRPWPDGVRALEEAERKEMQTLLAARGHEIGDIDGVLGSKTRAAIKAFQKEKGMEADGFPTPKVLEMLRGS